MKQGKFIVIEGTDGSGKTEQFKRLIAWLRGREYRAEAVDFPQYRSPSAFFVEKYLRGEYGGWRAIGPRVTSLFYALDRFDTAPRIRAALRAGRIVVANRYVASNMGHQGAKITSPAARRAFMRWEHELEYDMLNIPKPDVNIFLSVPPETAFRLVAEKGKREYLRGKKRDVHEADIRHLRQAAASYRDAIRLFPRDFRVIECAPKGKLLGISEIHRAVRLIVEEYLRT